MATAIHLVWTGIAMGVVHVLTGPDHLSVSKLSSLPLLLLRLSRFFIFRLFHLNLNTVTSFTITRRRLQPYRRPRLLSRSVTFSDSVPDGESGTARD